MQARWILGLHGYRWRKPVASAKIRKSLDSCKFWGKKMLERWDFLSGKWYLPIMDVAKITPCRWSEQRTKRRLNRAVPKYNLGEIDEALFGRADVGIRFRSNWRRKSGVWQTPETAKKNDGKIRIVTRTTSYFRKNAMALWHFLAVRCSSRLYRDPKVPKCQSATKKWIVSSYAHVHDDPEMVARMKGRGDGVTTWIDKNE